MNSGAYTGTCGVHKRRGKPNCHKVFVSFLHWKPHVKLRVFAFLVFFYFFGFQFFIPFRSQDLSSNDSATTTVMPILRRSVTQVTPWIPSSNVWLSRGDPGGEKCLIFWKLQQMRIWHFWVPKGKEQCQVISLLFAFSFWTNYDLTWNKHSNHRVATRTQQASPVRPW